jgi:hypothetical protein
MEKGSEKSDPYPEVGCDKTVLEKEEVFRELQQNPRA